jgi:hypothetical protein
MVDFEAILLIITTASYLSLCHLARFSESRVLGITLSFCHFVTLLHCYFVTFSFHCELKELFGSAFFSYFNEGIPVPVKRQPV